MKTTLCFFASRICFTLVAAFLFGLPLPARADCTAFTFNNGNIETPASGTVADNWTSYTRGSGSAVWAMNNTWSSTGTRSQLIVVSATGAGNAAGIYQDITSVTYGATYQIDVIEYPNSTSATAEVRIATDGGTDFDAATPLWVDHTASPKTMSGTVTAASTSMRLWLDTSVSTANKAVYWDAVTVTCIGEATIMWATGDGTWDIDTTENWIRDGSPPTACKFANGYPVLFEDTYSGSSPITLTLMTTVLPGSISMTASKDFTISGSGGVIGGSGMLDLTGSGTLTLGGDTANTFSGVTTVNGAGVLQLDKSDGHAIGGDLNLTAGTVEITGSGGDQIPDTAAVTLNGLFDLNAHSETIGSLSGSGTVDTVGGGTPTLTFGTSTSTTFSGQFKNSTGTLSLSKAGTGTLTLTGDNTYSGATTVNGGALLVNGSIGSGPVTVNDTATLGGSGTIGGMVTVNAGGTLAPGAPLGTLTLAQAPTLDIGSTTHIHINKTAGPILTSCKLVVSSGGGTLAFAGTLTVTATGDALVEGDTFDLFDGDAVASPPLDRGIHSEPAGVGPWIAVEYFATHR